MALTGKARITQAYESLTNVNLKSTGATIIVPPEAGKLFVPRAAWARIDTRSGTGTLPTFKIGNGGAWELHNTGSLGTASHVAGEMVEITLDGTSRMFAFDIGTTGISITVVAASTYTTHVGRFWIEGYKI